MAVKLNNDEMDEAIYGCMNSLWRAYREATQKGDYDLFNDCVESLRQVYDDEAVNAFITGMGTGLTKALTRRARK